MKKYIFIFILGCSAYMAHGGRPHNDIADFAPPALDLFDERRYAYENRIFNNIPALSVAFGAGFLANTITKPASKNNRIVNGVALATLFGIPAIILIGIILNNTVYYHGSLSASDYLSLRYDLPLEMCRLGCYYLGYEVACSLQALEEEKVDKS